MVKHTQTIRRLLPTNCLSVFDHFVELGLKGLNFGCNFCYISGVGMKVFGDIGLEMAVSMKKKLKYMKSEVKLKFH